MIEFIMSHFIGGGYDLICLISEGLGFELTQFGGGRPWGASWIPRSS